MSHPNPHHDPMDQVEMEQERPLLFDFVAWVTTVQMDVDHIKGILSQSLSDEPEVLIKDLEDAEVWNARAGFILAEANSWLDKARKYYQPGKEGKTEADRKALLDAAVTDIAKFRDFMEVITDAIKSRLMLGMSVLGYLKQLHAQPAGQGSTTMAQKQFQGSCYGKRR